MSDSSNSKVAEGQRQLSGYMKSRAVPLAIGAVFGLFLRVWLYKGASGSAWSAMAGAFIFGAPLAVGAITVYVAERIERRTWHYYATAPWGAMAAMVFGTLFLMIEGLICAVVIVPMFMFYSSLGGLLMGAVCRLTMHRAPPMACLASLPIVCGLLFSSLPDHPQFGEVIRSHTVNAPASYVWDQIVNTSTLEANAVDSAYAMRIGVPQPVHGFTSEVAGERVRRSVWGKQVYFDEVVIAWQPHQYLAWTYRFYPDSFPPHALDDHVVLGGHYFDLLQTDFTLTRVGDTTQVTTRTRYRISTQFNTYSDWIAQLLIGNLKEHGLRSFARRSEARWREQRAASAS